MLVFYQMGDIGLIPCVSVLQNCLVILGPFYLLVFYKLDGWHWDHSMCFKNGLVTLGPFKNYLMLFSTEKGFF